MNTANYTTQHKQAHFNPKTEQHKQAHSTTKTEQDLFFFINETTCRLQEDFYKLSSSPN